MTKREDNLPTTVGVQAERVLSPAPPTTSQVDGAARLFRLAQLAEECSRDVILAYLRGREAEGEQEQNFANQSALAVYA